MSHCEKNIIHDLIYIQLKKGVKVKKYRAKSKKNI